MIRNPRLDHCGVRGQILFLMRRCFVSIATFALLVCGADAAGLFNYIKAVVNDSVITYDDVMLLNLNSALAAERAYAERPELLQQKREELLREGLTNLVERALILDEFKSSGKVLPETMIEDRIQLLIRRRFVDRVRMTQTLQQRGMTVEKYRKQLHDDIVVELMEQINVAQNVLISPQKVEAYYAEHAEQYKQGNEIKLRTIVLNEKSAPTMADVKKLAREISMRLEAGAPFKEMASIYSEGSARREGGDWGWIERKVLRKGLADVAFALEPGQRSGLVGFAPIEGAGYSIYRYNAEGQPIRVAKYSDKDEPIEEKDLDAAAAATLPDPQEFHLMLVEEKRYSRTKTIAEVKDEIERQLIAKERQRLHDQWISRLEKKALVLYY